MGQALRIREKDVSASMWLNCRIIDMGNGWIKVHFIGFHAKYDKTIYIDPNHEQADKYEIEDLE